MKESPKREREIQLAALTIARATAVIAVKQALEKYFPTGSAVLVFLNNQQLTPSHALVTNHDGLRGTVRVRLSKKNSLGEQGMRDVCWQRVRKDTDATC